MSLKDAIHAALLDPSIRCIVIEGDCLNVLPQLPSGLVDLTITDPPYESLERHRKVGTTTRLKKSKSSSNKWFQTFPNTGYYSLFKELYRVHKNNTHCYVFCDSETEHVILSGRNPYTGEDVGLLSPAEIWTAWPPLTWVKTKIACADDVDDLQDEDIRSGMGYHWRRCEERILFLEKGKRRLKNLGWKNVLVGPRAGKGAFPTQKPVHIVGRLAANSLSDNRIGPQPNILLDPFAGSGTLGHVASGRGDRCILIDLDISWILEHPPTSLGMLVLR